MIGAIIGDIIGSNYEYKNNKTKDIELFSPNSVITDDSILTFAVFEALEEAKGDYKDLNKRTAKKLLKWVNRYPNPGGGYGVSFYYWAMDGILLGKPLPPYNSYGNGSAMRVSPVAYFASSLDECILLSKKVTEVTHNHPEGIKGAEAVAVAIYLALEGESKEAIQTHMKTHYYDLNQTLDEIRPTYRFDETCQNTVPQSLQAFFESTSFEDAIRNAISLGGDADTIGAITGAIAGAYYGVDDVFREFIFEKIDEYQIDVLMKMMAYAKKRHHIA